jgi:hypothetical protein
MLWLMPTSSTEKEIGDLFGVRCPLSAVPTPAEYTFRSLAGSKAVRASRWARPTRLSAPRRPARPRSQPSCSPGSNTSKRNLTIPRATSGRIAVVKARRAASRRPATRGGRALAMTMRRGTHVSHGCPGNRST